MRMVQDGQNSITRKGRLLPIGSRRSANPIPALFANGERGFFYDPSDLTTMFQDAAGTVPVTGPGQPVGRMLDKSGRGNHASQPTAAARPTLGRHPKGVIPTPGQFDLTIPGVPDVWYLHFNGVNQFLDSMPIAGGVQSNVWMSGAFSMTAYTGSTSSSFLFGMAGGLGNDLGFLSRYQSESTRISLYRMRRDGGSQVNASIPFPAVGIAFVPDAYDDSASIFARVNAGGDSTAAVPFTGESSAATPIRLGTSSGGLSFLCYGVFMRVGPPTPAERKAVLDYFTDKVGIAS